MSSDQIAYCDSNHSLRRALPSPSPKHGITGFKNGCQSEFIQDRVRAVSIHLERAYLVTDAYSCIKHRYAPIFWEKNHWPRLDLL